MSLVISLINKNRSGDIDYVYQYSHEIKRDEAFGPESWRDKVWGNYVTEKLGCKIINTIKDKDLYCYDENIKILKEDFEKLLNNFEKFILAINFNDFSKSIRVSSQTPHILNYNQNSIKEYILNALEHIRVAQKYSDKIGVVLW